MLQTSVFLYLKTSFNYAFFFFLNYVPHWILLLCTGLWSFLLVLGCWPTKEAFRSHEEDCYHASTGPSTLTWTKTTGNFGCLLEEKWICLCMWEEEAKQVNDVLKEVDCKWQGRYSPVSMFFHSLWAKNIFSTPLWRGLANLFLDNGMWVEVMWAQFLSI